MFTVAGGLDNASSRFCCQYITVDNMFSISRAWKNACSRLLVYHIVNNVFSIAKGLKNACSRLHSVGDNVFSIGDCVISLAGSVRSRIVL